MLMNKRLIVVGKRINGCVTIKVGEKPTKKS